MLFLDVETTGLHSEDRIVSLAAIRLNRDAIKNGEVTIDYAYLVFDPERKKSSPGRGGPRVGRLDASAPGAVLREPGELRVLLAGTDLIVAHNAEFDLRFVARELAIAGRPPLEARYCTLQGYRGQLWPSVARRDLPAIWLAAFQHAWSVGRRLPVHDVVPASSWQAQPRRFPTSRS